MVNYKKKNYECNNNNNCKYCNLLFFCSIESEDICIVERLFSSSLVAVVSLSSPRKLRVCHFKKGNEICNYSYSNTILGVKLNRAVSIFLSNSIIYIFLSV